ncbi:WS/DGAT/MGAT family O-acyltransferase [Zhongshania marina]|uniref:diacylglycerol O-acyltransferase n=1 Tax=Zhongshania marina TaxID=2304603 RepID=A0ABX9W3M4_9GAMM|nr:wax ester/triacylglycerol synthase family O-acyltransferase [Zhongshania marina]
MKQLDFLDSVFLSMDKSAIPMHIGVLNIYDMGTRSGEVLRFKDVLDAFRNSLPMTPSYRRKLKAVPFDIDRPYWIDDVDFDLEYHVRHIALPKPGDWRQLCILAARVFSRPLDMTRPLWECYVIEGLDNVEDIPKGSFALLFKYHHAAFDGKAAAEALYSALHSESAEGGKAYYDNFDPEPTPAGSELLIRSYINAISSPFTVIKRLSELVNIKSPQGKLRKAPKIEPTRFNKPISPNRVFISENFELAKLKNIKNCIPGTTINDVVLAIVSGALREYLMSKEELPDTTLTSGVPMNIRVEGDTSGGNLVTILNVSLNTHIQDPVERLRAISDDVQQNKLYNDAVKVRKQIDALDGLPSAMLSLGVKAATRNILLERIRPPFNTIVTNVPGPQKPMYFCGAEMITTIGMGCPVNNLGLFHTVCSYNGWLRITPIGCREMLPDPDFYASCIQRSYKELADAVLMVPEVTASSA